MKRDVIAVVQTFDFVAHVLEQHSIFLQVHLQPATQQTQYVLYATH